MGKYSRGLILNINFSTKPCVGKREKILKIYLPFFLIIVLTLVNLSVFLYYRLENSSSHGKIDKLKREISNYNKKIALNLSDLKKVKFKQFKKEYAFYYSMSVKRKLSWADLFERFEKILPEDVKLAMISPKVEGKKILLSISAEAKSKESELKFVENLAKNKKFAHPFIEYESLDPSGSLKFSISVEYRIGK